MSAERLRELLASRGRPWPAPIETFEVLRSTNDHLRERARAGAPTWSVAIAGRQSAGRGRSGHAWVSPPGNLYMSALVRPPSPAEARPLLPLMAGLSVAEGLAEFGVEARLKWPNDVLSGDRKLAGVLAEGSSGGGLDFVVVGIGVNVAADPGVESAELRDRAATMRALTASGLDPIEVAAAVLIRLHDRYAELEAGGGPALLRAWRARSVPWWGLPVEVVSGEEVVRGIAVDVDDGGGLVLRLFDGGRRTLVAGEARQLRLRHA